MSDFGRLSKIELSGFKSIEQVALEFSNLNILIGANGSGKSNLISFFKFINKLLNQELQLYVAQKGTAENFLSSAPNARSS